MDFAATEEKLYILVRSVSPTISTHDDDLPMPVQPAYINDKIEILVRKCIVFPADGSDTRLVHMVARTVTSEDIAPLTLFNRCVDLASTFGDGYYMTQVLAYQTTRNDLQSTYLFFYNLSRNLPVNLNAARIIGITPSQLKHKKRLFWRGDVVAMKVQPSESEFRIVESLDADPSDLNLLGEFFLERFQDGSLDRFLEALEQQCEQESFAQCQPSQESLQGTCISRTTADLLRCSAPQKPTGEETRQRRKVQEHCSSAYSYSILNPPFSEFFLHRLNELRCAVG
jgi:hypothetical protein